MQPDVQTTAEVTRLSYWADWSSLVGFVIALVGFAVTIWAALKSKSAAEQAAKAAREARSSLLRADSVAGVASIISGLEDLKRLHRAGAWEGMPERYGAQRRVLIEVRAASVSLSDPQKTLIQRAMNDLAMLEQQVEQYLARPEIVPDVAKLNRLLTKHTDGLTQLLTELKIDGEHV